MIDPLQEFVLSLLDNRALLEVFNCSYPLAAADICLCFASTYFYDLINSVEWIAEFNIVIGLGRVFLACLIDTDYFNDALRLLVLRNIATLMGSDLR